MKFLASMIQPKSRNGSTLLVWPLLNLMTAGIAHADTQIGTLAAQAGAIDVYQLNCNSLENVETSYASLKLMDTTSDAQPPQAPQVINVELSKDGSTPVSNSIPEGNSSQFVVAGGNGKYQLKIDTTGSNPGYPKQNYQVFFQCYNGNNVVTAGSGGGLKAGKYVNKTITTYKNKKTQIPSSKVYTINCKANKKVVPNDSNFLKVVISNTSLHFDTSQAYLNAQLTRLEIGSTINASDQPGDDQYGAPVQLTPVNNSGISVGNGNYYISIDTTADDKTQFKQKSYSFEYGCHSSTGNPTSASINQIQDQ